MMTGDTLLCFDESKYENRELPSKFDLQHAALNSLMCDYCVLIARMWDDALFVRNCMRIYAQVIIDRLSLVERTTC